MNRAYVQQTENGEWLNESCYRVSRGFRDLGYAVQPFTSQNLPIDSGVVAYGDEATIRFLLKRARKTPPEILRYPYCLRAQFLDRTPSEVALRVVAESLHLPNYRPVFLQPSRDPFLFSGKVISTLDDLLSLGNLPDATPVWKSQVIPFLSEYRAFVHRGELVGMWFLKGDPLVFPDSETVRRMIRSAKTMSQIAFSLDIGVARFPERPEKIRTPTLLIGAHEIYEANSFSLDSAALAQMSIDRWNQF